jgi:hypothetical protein
MFRTALALVALAYASGTFAQSTSTTIDMGGGMSHVDTMGPNGEMSSSNCMKLGGGITTCQTMDMSQPSQAKPAPDISQPQTDGATLNFFGGLVARSQGKSFQKKLGKLLASGDCDGAYVEAFIKQQFELANQIRRSCQPPASANPPETITAEQFMAGTLAPSSSGLGQMPATSALMSLVSAKTITPSHDTPENDTEYTVSYLGHSFQLVGPKGLSVDDIKSGFEKGWEEDPWIQYSSSGSGSVYFYNIKTQRNFADRIEVWIMADHSKNKTVKARTAKLLYEISCNRQSIRELQSVEYDARGKVLLSFDEPTAPIRVIPETVGSALYDEMCKFGS